MRPYADYASAYLEAGYFPIPAAGKRVIKNSHHGRDKPLVTESEVSKWSRLHPSANIAARLPRDVIGIDVDAYGSKPGEETLAQLEEMLGPLPATIVSTARDDGCSGIRLFRIPQQYWSVIWPGKAGEGIDIIWHGNRYMIVWPSVHPDTGQTYLWYDQNDDGTMDTLNLVPDLSDEWLPDFPRDWCDYFARVDQQEGSSYVADTADWIKSHAAGDMCEYMTSAVDKATDEIAANAHDSAKSAVYNILRSSVRGHTGGSKALAKVKAMFLEEMAYRDADRRRGAESEWRRSVDGAVRKAQRLGEEEGFATADPCSEMVGGFSPIRVTGRVRSFATVQRERARWLWPGYLAFQCVTLLDADPSQGKSVTTIDIVARLTTGRAMPGQPEAVLGPANALILAPEDPAASVMLPRLEAAGADMSRVFCEEYEIKRNKRGEAKVPGLYLPQHSQTLGYMIAECDASLLIIDPITSFLGEDVKSHNDASVRTALTPLASMLQNYECACLMTRHFNKNADMAAMYRGGGSVAFVAASRVALVSAWLPDSEQDEFGIAITKNNYMPRAFKNQTLTGRIVDSEVQFDELGTMTPKVKWGDVITMSADQLLGVGMKRKHGPASPAQDDVIDALELLFEERDEIPESEVVTFLKARHISTNSDVLSKAKKRFGVRSWPKHRRGSGGITHWVWRREEHDER